MSILASGTTNGWQYPAANNPTILNGSADFSVLSWIRTATVPPAANAAINAINNCFWTRINTSGQFESRLGQTGTITLAAGTLASNTWTLVGISWKQSEGRMRIFSRQAGDVASVTNTATGTPTFGTATASTWRCGVFSTFDGFQGVHALTVVRSHAIAQSDFDAIFARADLFDLYDYSEGAFNGSAGCEFMLGHGCVYSVGEAYIGKAIATPQAMFARSVSSSNLLSSVTLTGVAGTLTWVDVHESYPGFFNRRLPGTGSAFTPIGAGRRAVLKEIVDQATTSHRKVLIVANSRGAVNTAMTDDTSTSTARKMPGNYVGGWISARRARASGRLNKRCFDSATGQDFGLSFDTAPYKTGSPSTLSGASDGFRNFCRAWTGSHGTSDDQGPGNGVVIPVTQSYCSRVRDEPDSLLSKDHPLHVEMYVRKFPGSATINWIKTKATANNLAGTDIGSASGAIALDTAIAAAATIATSPTQKQFTFADASATIHDAIVVSASSTGHYAVVSNSTDTTCRGVARITSKSHSLGITTVNLSHDIRDTITDASDKVRIGPLSIQRIEAEFDAIAGGDTETLRGIKVTAGSSGLGLIIHAQSCWTTRTDAYGEVVGEGGWSSHGYAEQLDETLDANGKAFALWDWVTAIRPDVIFWAGAQQNPTTASDLGLMIDATRVVDSDQEMHIAYETRHDTESFTSDTDTGWNDWIEANAASKQVCAVTIFEDEDFGVLLEQFASGYRDDGAHYQTRGSREIVERWLELFGTINLSAGTRGLRNRNRGVRTLSI